MRLSDSAAISFLPPIFFSVCRLGARVPLRGEFMMICCLKVCQLHRGFVHLTYQKHFICFAVVCKASTARVQIAQKVAVLSTLPAALVSSPAWALVRLQMNV